MTRDMMEFQKYRTRIAEEATEFMESLGIYFIILYKKNN
jgi:hypothetical protein